jgi:phosphotransferase system enzyme I (PtsI)
MRHRGIGVSPGLAAGKAVVVERRTTTIFRIPIPADQIDNEVARLDQAREMARGQINGLLERITNLVGETFGRVFAAHLLILDDLQLSDGTKEIIRSERVNAEWALKTVAEKLLRAFAQIEDTYLRERGGDLEDVHNRLQLILAGERHHHKLSELEEDSVVVAHSLSPSDAALLDHDRVVALCTDVGGRTSHTAILANALQIPAVVGLHDMSPTVMGGDLVVVDGGHGEVLLRPTPENLAAYRRARIEFDRHGKELQAERDLPVRTQDGEEVTLEANIEIPEELDTAISHGARGIGLYRSEFLFLARSPELPTEEDHRKVYEELAGRVAPAEAVIRTLDLGGDKYFHEVLDKNEANPVMGLRAIRFCLRRQDIFRTQLRGLLRASVHPNIKVMFPLVSGVDELRRARQVLKEVQQELSDEGRPFNPEIQIGTMIEVPSAALIADRLAEEVDFFSIGTNDLLQYCLALDRGNESVSYLYQPFHPALLRLLHGVVTAAQTAGIGVSLCGEMASDPFAIPVLVGLGLRTLSLNSTSIPEVRSAVRRVHARRAREMVEDILGKATAEEVEARVREEFPAPEPARETVFPETENAGKAASDIEESPGSPASSKMGNR